MRDLDTTQNFVDDVNRIRLEVEAMKNGAGDDMFQTREIRSEDQRRLNRAINRAEPAGESGYDSMVRDRLQELLPLEQEVNPKEDMPPELMEDIVKHFRSVVKDIPESGLSHDDLDRERSEFHQFADRIWSGEACRFPDQLLRRVRPYVPFKRNLDCCIANCLMMQGICDEYGIPYDAVERAPDGQLYRYKDHEGFPWERRSLRIAIEAIFLSIYLSRLAIEIAAWLPYELMVVQDCNIPDLQEAFIDGRVYWPHGLPPDMDDFQDAYFYICLAHVVKWLEHRGGFDAILWSNPDSYHDWFWAAVDKGAGIWYVVEDSD